MVEIPNGSCHVRTRPCIAFYGACERCVARQHLHWHSPVSSVASAAPSFAEASAADHEESIPSGLAHERASRAEGVRSLSLFAAAPQASAVQSEKWALALEAGGCR